MAATDVAVPASYPHLTSVERISKLPVVEQSVDLASSIYGRVKEINPLLKSVLSTAETTVKGAVDLTLPVTAKLESPIKMVDSILCSSLDYVETKVPAVKLPPNEMYQATRDYVLGIPVVKCACEIGEEGVRRAVDCACVVSQYSNQKLHELKDSLAVAEAEQKTTDLRAFFSVYLYTLLHVLTAMSSWVGLGKSEEQQQETKKEDATEQKTETNQKPANGNAHANQRGPSEGDEDDVSSESSQ